MKAWVVVPLLFAGLAGCAFGPGGDPPGTCGAWPTFRGLPDGDTSNGALVAELETSAPIELHTYKDVVYWINPATNAIYSHCVPSGQTVRVGDAHYVTEYIQEGAPIRAVVSFQGQRSVVDVDLERGVINHDISRDGYPSTAMTDVRLRGDWMLYTSDDGMLVLHQRSTMASEELAPVDGYDPRCPRLWAESLPRVVTVDSWPAFADCIYEVTVHDPGQPARLIFEGLGTPLGLVFDGDRLAVEAGKGTDVCVLFVLDPDQTYDEDRDPIMTPSKRCGSERWVEGGLVRADCAYLPDSSAMWDVRKSEGCKAAVRIENTWIHQSGDALIRTAWTPIDVDLCGYEEGPLEIGFPVDPGATINGTIGDGIAAHATRVDGFAFLTVVCLKSGDHGRIQLPDAGTAEAYPTAIAIDEGLWAGGKLNGEWGVTHFPEPGAGDPAFYPLPTQSHRIQVTGIVDVDAHRAVALADDLTLWGFDRTTGQASPLWIEGPSNDCGLPPDAALVDGSVWTRRWSSDCETVLAWHGDPSAEFAVQDMTYLIGANDDAYVLQTTNQDCLAIIGNLERQLRHGTCPAITVSDAGIVVDCERFDPVAWTFLPIESCSWNALLGQDYFVTMGNDGGLRIVAH